MPLLERDAEMATLAGLLEGLAGSGEGGTLLIEGEAGIGKSSLLGALVGAARDRDVRVLTARGTELEHDLAFGAVRQLFRPVPALPAAERDELLAGPASLPPPCSACATRPRASSPIRCTRCPGSWRT